MVWIYLLESNPKKMKSKPPPLFSFFLGHRTDTIMTHSVHCLRKMKGYYVRCVIYIDTVATCVADISIAHRYYQNLVAMGEANVNIAHRYCQT
jgi:hypothetical protein